MARLHITEIASVGLVDSGDNPAAEITFFKRAPSCEQVRKDGLPCRNAPLTGQSVCRVHKQSPGRVQLRTEKRMADFDLSALDLEEEVLEGLTAYVDGLKAQIPEEEPTEKHSPEVAELLAKHQAEAETLRKRLDDEIAKRREAEAVAKADKAGWGILASVEKIGPAVARFEANTATQDDITTLTETLNSAAAAVKAGKVFDEIGASDGDNDPMSKRDAWVTKYRQDNPDVSVLEARSRYWETHPDEMTASREV